MSHVNLDSSIGLGEKSRKTLDREQFPNRASLPDVGASTTRKQRQKARIITHSESEDDVSEERFYGCEELKASRWRIEQQVRLPDVRDARLGLTCYKKLDGFDVEEVTGTHCRWESCVGKGRKLDAQSGRSGRSGRSGKTRDQNISNGESFTSWFQLWIFWGCWLGIDGWPGMHMAAKLMPSESCRGPRRSRSIT